MKKDIIRSVIVLLTIANGIIAAFSLGMTELIKYLLQDAAGAKGMNISIDEIMLGDLSMNMMATKDNLGWVFLALMLLGIVIIIAMNSDAKFHIDHK